MSTDFIVDNFPHDHTYLMGKFGMTGTVDGDTVKNGVPRGTLITIDHDYTEAEQAALLAILQACKPLGLSVTAQAVTVQTSPDVASIVLSVDGVNAPAIDLVNGIGELALTLPVGGDDRTVQVAENLRPIFGYRKVTVKCPTA